MKTRVFIGSILAVIFSTITAKEAPESIPSDKQAMEAIEALIKSPTARGAKDHVATILVFAEGSPAVRVALNVEYLPWISQDKEVENAEILLGAIVGGNVLPQLKKGVKRDHTKEGLIAMLNAYELLRKEKAIVGIKELDRWSSMNDSELDQLIKEVAERASPLPPRAEAASNVEFVNVTLYQPDEILRERGIDSEEFAGYTKQLIDVLSGELSANQDSETLDVALIVRPGRKARTWFVSSLKTPPKRDSLAASLEKIAPVEVKGGPLAFAISLNIAGAKRDAPQDGEFEPPMPKEWIKAAEDEGDGTLIPEGIVEALWKDK